MLELRSEWNSEDTVAPIKNKFVVYNLRETYHELGKYDFKIVLNPKFFKNGHMSELKCVDSDRKNMKFSCEKWGRKINCSFIIDNDVSDGVSIVDMNLKDENGKEYPGRITFWVIKP